MMLAFARGRVPVPAGSKAPLCAGLLSCVRLDEPNGAVV